VLHRHEFVSLRSCRLPFSLLFLSLLCSHRRNSVSFSRSLVRFSPSRVIPPRKAPAACGTQPSSKNTSRSADPKSESTPRISRAILSDQRAIGLTIFLFVALAAQVIFKATFGNGDSNTLELFSRVTYLLMRAYHWPQACLDFNQTMNDQRCHINVS